jgi:hypothetical protein
MYIYTCMYKVVFSSWLTQSGQICTKWNFVEYSLICNCVMQITQYAYTWIFMISPKIHVQYFMKINTDVYLQWNTVSFFLSLSLLNHINLHKSKELGPRRVRIGPIKWAKLNWSFDKSFSAWNIRLIWWFMKMVILLIFRHCLRDPQSHTSQHPRIC